MCVCVPVVASYLYKHNRVDDDELQGAYETRNGTEWNQLGRTLVKIYYVALAVPKFAGLFSVVLLYLVVFLY